MRITVISNLFPPEVQGGYELLCHQVVEYLVARGHQLSVLTTPCSATVPPQPWEESRELKLLAPFPGPAPRSRRAAQALLRHNREVVARQLSRWRPEVVFLWSQLRLGAGPARAAEASGFPVLFTWNDDHVLGLAPVPWGRGLRGLVGAALDRSWYRGCTWSGLRFPRALVISRCLAEGLRRGGYSGPLKVCYQGVDLRQFPLKDRPGALGSPLRLLYVGQLHAYKGVHTVIEAVQHCPEVSLSIVGSGNAAYEAQLRQLARGAAERITFWGRRPRSELAHIYRDHDVFVFPSVWPEPYGLTHLEAMACGLPLLATLHGGPGEHLVEGQNCLSFEAERADQLAGALLRLRDNPPLAAQLALAGRRLVEEELNFERYAASVEEALWRSLTP